MCRNTQSCHTAICRVYERNNHAVAPRRPILDLKIRTPTPNPNSQSLGRIRTSLASSLHTSASQTNPRDGKLYKDNYRQSTYHHQLLQCHHQQAQDSPSIALSMAIDTVFNVVVIGIPAFLYHKLYLQHNRSIPSESLDTVAPSSLIRYTRLPSRKLPVRHKCPLPVPSFPFLSFPAPPDCRSLLLRTRDPWP